MPCTWFDSLPKIMPWTRPKSGLEKRWRTTTKLIRASALTTEDEKRGFCPVQSGKPGQHSRSLDCARDDSDSMTFQPFLRQGPKAHEETNRQHSIMLGGLWFLVLFFPASYQSLLVVFDSAWSFVRLRFL